MTLALVIYGAVLVLVTFGSIMLPHGSYTPAHDSTRAIAAHATTTGAPQISYTGNPYRIGAYVYVQEDSSPSSIDWTGTFLGMRDGMALVRDTSGMVVNVSKDLLYSAQR